MTQNVLDNHLINDKDFDILEYRPNKFVKVRDGKVIGKASKDDVRLFRLQRVVGR